MLTIAFRNCSRISSKYSFGESIKKCTNILMEFLQHECIPGWILKSISNWKIFVVEFLAVHIPEYVHFKNSSNLVSPFYVEFIQIFFQGFSQDWVQEFLKEIMIQFLIQILKRFLLKLLVKFGWIFILLKIYGGNSGKNPKRFPLRI